MKKFLLLALVAGFVAACGEKSTADKAKDALDNAADKGKDAIDKVGK